MKDTILIDYKVNTGRPHIQLLLASLRLAQIARKSDVAIFRALDPLFSLIYRLPALFLYGIDIPVSTAIGPRLRIHHGIGLVVNSNSIIGSDVVLRQNVTIGNKDSGASSPHLGDRVDIGAGAIIIGDIIVESDSVIGAGSVVTKSVFSGKTVVGNPAREIVVVDPGQKPA